jgi:hypothetical protein
VISGAALFFLGTWIFQYEGRNFLVLTIAENGGSLTKPAQSEMNSEGEITKISGGPKRTPISHMKFTREGVRFSAGEDRFVIRRVDQDHASLKLADAAWMIPPMRLERARASQDVTVASEWPAPEYPPDVAALQKELRSMEEADQAVRMTTPISVSRMEEVDRKHRPELERIFERYGWPKRSVVSREAAHDYWLLVQHQPLDVQQRMLPAMERAMQDGEASKSDYAYLYDRVRVGEGKPQHWGSQMACVKGKAVLSPVDDPAGLEQRRRELHLPPIKEYRKLVEKQCAALAR